MTFWGVIDTTSWLQTRNSVGGAADGSVMQYPLLFDGDYKVKPAFWAFADEAKYEESIKITPIPTPEPTVVPTEEPVEEPTEEPADKQDAVPTEAPAETPAVSEGGLSGVVIAIVAVAAIILVAVVAVISKKKKED